MNTSIRDGSHYIQELLEGHPYRFYNKFGMSKHVFQCLASALHAYTHFQHSKHISMAEQLGIFLSFCRTGSGFQAIQEDFQHSMDTISRVIHNTLNCILDPAFYTCYVKLPSADQVPLEIRSNPQFFPFFKDCLGAIDGTHIDAFVPSIEHCRYRDRKGRLSQNVLAACTFDLRFCYVMAGWEGSAGDGRVFESARIADFSIPAGKYYLADAGFPSRPDLLVPYRGVHYHLKEWGSANIRPQNKEELFNLWHAKARNAVERIFGIAKRRFKLLTTSPEFDTTTQAKIILALCCLHNVVRVYERHNHTPVTEISSQVQEPHLNNNLTASVSAAEQSAANDRRDSIASDMWNFYQNYCAAQERNNP
ncbi:hypothetical protein ACEPAH_3042 [Sanghuangporus vaninii]